MTNNKKTTRIAGAWYLAFILLGAFSIMFVDGSLAVIGDKLATLENSRSNLALFILGAIAYVAGYICFVFVANNLGKLFKSTESRLTLFMRITVYAGVAVALACKIAQIIAVAASDENLQTLYETGTAAAVIFWGLWLLPLGLLILKSNLIPKAIGILLLGACAANLVDFAAHFIVPGTPEAVLNVCYIIGMLGEFGLVLWLLIKNDGIEFTNLSEINTLDLSKLPTDDDSTDLWYWLKFIKTDDEEVLDMLATRSPQMRKAVGVLKELSADEQTRMLYEKREMARRDIESSLEAERKKLQEAVAVIADKDAVIADKDAVIADKDAVIADKDAENEQLRMQIAELQKKTNGS